MGDSEPWFFDFDEWAALASADPVAFEAKRRQAIEALIAEAPEHIRHRLRCFQWRIDQERQKCSNPLSACLRLYTMMWDSVYAERGLLWALQMLSGRDSPLGGTEKAARSAEILTFRPVRPAHPKSA